jgi:hypothetical protein
MDTVQGGLNMGNNGRGQHDKRSSCRDHNIVRGIVERLRQRGSNTGRAEGTPPFPDEALDLPGLDVPDLEE